MAQSRLSDGTIQPFSVDEEWSGRTLVERLNVMLPALASNHSGVNAPGGAAAGQMWFNPSTRRLSVQTQDDGWMQIVPEIGNEDHGKYLKAQATYGSRQVVLANGIIDKSYYDGAIEIDQNGYVKTPYRSWFSARTYYSDHQPMIDAAPHFICNAQSADAPFTSGTQHYFAKCEGLHFFHAHALVFMAGSSAAYGYIDLLKNGVLQARAITPNGAVMDYIDLTVAAPLQLNFGDQVQVRFTGQNGAKWYSSPTYNSFSGYFIG